VIKTFFSTAARGQMAAGDNMPKSATATTQATATQTCRFWLLLLDADR
jgi:hypothetical protein